MCPPFCCKTHVIGDSRRRLFSGHWYLTPARLSTTPHCIIKHRLSNMHNGCCCSNTPWMASMFPLLLLMLFSHLSILVLLNILCWNSRSRRRKRNPGFWLSFRQVTPLRVINLMRLELADVFRAKRRWSVLKSCKRCSGVLKMWALKDSGLVFFGPPCNIVHTTYGRWGCVADAAQWTQI